MSEFETITARVDVQTMNIVRGLALARGMSGEQFVVDAIRRVAESDADLDAFLAVGEDEISRGDFVDHAGLITNIRRWREDRTRPS